MIRGLVLGLAAGLLLLLLSACGTEPSALADLTPEEVVEERAQARWDALLAGDVEQAYGYASPAYRSAKDLPRFQARFGSAIRRTAAEVTIVECNAERCSVTVMVTYEVPQLRTGNTRALRETWILSDGEWWIHID